MKKTRALTIIIAAILSLTVAFVPSDSHAASKKVKKATLYNVIVKGGYAYCAVENGIYKVHLKKKTKKRLTSTGGCYTAYMRYYKGYLYYVFGEPMPDLYRIKTSGKQKKRLVRFINSFALSNGKLYYNKYNNWSDKRTLKRVAKLNGKKVKKSKYRVKNTWKKSNKKGYKIVSSLNKRVLLDKERYYDEEEETYYYEYSYAEYYTDYLVTPKGERISLGTRVEY